MRAEAAEFVPGGGPPLVKGAMCTRGATLFSPCGLAADFLPDKTQVYEAVGVSFGAVEVDQASESSRYEDCESVMSEECVTLDEQCDAASEDLFLFNGVSCDLIQLPCGQTRHRAVVSFRHSIQMCVDFFRYSSLKLIKF